MKKHPYRYLQGYTLDPGFSGRLDTTSFNHTVYRIRWEDMIPPKDERAPQHINGEYFEVIDIDPPGDCYYEPLNLNSIEVLSQNGLPPSEGNPQFHQQFVYTIAMKTLDSFERALGRKVIWSSRSTGQGKRDYVGKVRLYPHALREANAYYDPAKKSLLFGYFKSSPRQNGVSFPGGVVFTCLSPDIIAHEVCHALLDSVHPRFIENTNSDVPAFHEAFADIVALLQRFTMSELVESQLRSTRGDLNEFNVLGELATQFGNALSHGHGALRSAIGKYDDEKEKWVRRVPDPTLYQTLFEPHDRGALLVAAFFDALIKVYTYKTQDLIRIASDGTGILPMGMISYDLTKRLAKEIGRIAEHMLNIAIRALDYCPPVDINFGDYLRALITADLDAAPADDNNYRVALMESFRSWGIFPDLVNTFSEESLQWSKLPGFTDRESEAIAHIGKIIRNNVRDILSLSDREEIFNAYNRKQHELSDFLASGQTMLGPEAWNEFLPKLGLSAKAVLDSPEILNMTKTPCSVKPPEVHKIRPVYRIGREGNILEQVVVTLTQKAEMPLGDDGSFTFRGGCTLIFNLANNFSLDYIIVKNIASTRRFLAQWNYQQGNTQASHSAFHDSIYEEDNCSCKISFARLHFNNGI
jgi:hypothetical protein